MSLPNTPVLVKLSSSHEGPGSGIIQPVMLSLKNIPPLSLPGILCQESVNDKSLETDLLRGD